MGSAVHSRRSTSRATWALAWALALAASPAYADVLGLPAYPQLSTPIPADMRTNGVPQRTRIAFTDDPVRTVLRFYREALLPRGVSLLEHAYSLNSAYIGYFDQASSQTHLVSAMGQPDGRTMLVFSSMDPRPLVGLPTATPADLPCLPRAREVVSTDGTYGGTRHRTLHYVVPGMTPEGARRALAEKAAADGWQVQGEQEALPGQDFSLSRGSATCMIQVQAAVDPDAGGPAAAVTMVVLETGVSAPAEEKKP